MTTQPQPPMLLTYDQACDRLDSHPVRTEEVPVEHFISLPLPTKRWSQPAWTCFAAPAVRRPGQTQVGAPDRWWAIAARGGRLLAYAMEAVLPTVSMAEDKSPDVALQALSTLAPPTDSLEEHRRRLQAFATAVDRVAEAFFQDRPAPQSNRRATATALEAAVAAELLRYYRALAPDFMAWLTL